MMRVRRLLLGLASGSAFYSGLVPALGLGEITLHSALNQPLEAEIELLEVGDLSASDLLVRLAPAEVFNRSGVDRLVFLNDLRFTPLLHGGSSVVRVLSNQPVREPYLNFIVEVVRPNGRLLREYTVLLDPPGSSAYRAVAALPATAPRALPAETQTPAAAAPAVPAVQPLAELGRRYRVERGDSLWTIAARLRADGSTASQQRLMGEIHALNPQAFARGDKDRLLAGADLLLPDVAAPARDATPPSAAAMTGASAQAPAPDEPGFDPQAELIAQVQRRVDQELAAQATENLQLQQTLADVQEQLQQLQAQMDSKDRQLAMLQAQLDQRPVPEESLDAAALPAVEAPAAAAQDVPSSVQERSWYGVAGAALLVALLGLAGVLRRSQRRRAAPETVRPDVPEPMAEAPEPPARPLASTPQVRVEAIPAAAPGHPAPPSDALEGANIYIAYGRFSEAAAALRKALESQPQRSDIRFRLLEVLGQLGDAPGFAAQEVILRDSGFTAARIDQLKARYPGLTSAEPAGLLDDAVLALDEVPAQTVEPADDFQLNLDDLSLDADWDLVTPSTPSARKKSTAAPVSAIGSNHDDLPDVEELAGEGDARSPFAASMLVEETTAEAWLQDDLDEAFVGQAQAADSALFSDLDHLAGSSDNLAKLNLALAYIEQGSLESACGILNEVISDGDDEEKQQARELLARIA